MDRRTFLFAIGGGLLGVPLAATAQSVDRVWRVGFLSNGSRPPDGAPPAALRQALHDLGYVDGKNLTYTSRWAETMSDRLPTFAAELAGLKMDVIVALGAPATEAAKDATATIPIVITGAGDAAATGLVASLARPGGNVTGITEQAAELSAKRLELLKAVMPSASRIAVLWNAGDRAMTHRYQEVERAAGVLRVTIQALGVREPDDFDRAFTAMTHERPDALLLVTDALTTVNRKRVLDFAAKHRMPAMYERSLYVRDGGLMSYGPIADDSLRRVAVYIDRIFKGAKPVDLPVEQPTRFELVINLKTAKALGLTIPQSLLLRADEVIR
ncbi:MAG: ABC transporter substrate-binding protein [Casimicrobiaceae bacterium]